MAEANPSFKQRTKAIPKNRETVGSLMQGVLNRGEDRERAPGDLRLFGDMLDRTRHIFSRKKIVRTGVTSVQPTPFEGDELRVVCIGSELDIWKSDAITPQHFRDGIELMAATAKYNSDAWIEARLKELKAALRKDPHIICFPEFAYPPPTSAVEGGWTVDEINSAVSIRFDFEQKVRAALKAKNVFVCLGSFHCPMTLYNVGVIYPWGAHRHALASYGLSRMKLGDHGRVLPYEEPFEDEIRTPILYRKRFPARKIGENARVPPRREVNVFECAFGKVLVLICSDLLDLNQFLMIVREGIEKRDFDYIVVPSYNPGRSFGTICRDLSGLAATTVIVASAADKTVKLTPSEVYVCGEAAGELATSQYDERHNVVAFEAIDPVGKTNLSLYRFSLSALKRARECQLERLGVTVRPDEGKK